MSPPFFLFFFFFDIFSWGGRWSKGLWFCGIMLVKLGLDIRGGWSITYKDTLDSRVNLVVLATSSSRLCIFPCSYEDTFRDIPNHHRGCDRHLSKQSVHITSRDKSTETVVGKDSDLSTRMYRLIKQSIYV
ncbi:hypothetical protein F4810DRAFT_595296 [Camillea tinctor]|nr:hypothetical protein F4810DRAFT_595296 [Camillea tinctor]